MKKSNLIRLIAIPTVIGLMLSLSFCKKDTETVTNTVTVHDTLKYAVHDTIIVNDTLVITVHDTVKGKAIFGAATYPDFKNVTTPAKGAVVILYSGASVDPNKIVAYTYANASGNYSFPYLLPGDYYITAKYNTENKNARLIEGINFATNPGYAVTLGTSDITRDISLVNITPTGSVKIAFDTTASGYTGFRKVTFELHSTVDFNFMDRGASTTLPGGFRAEDGFVVTKFAFDEANPSNTIIDGYVLLSSINTFEPTRDALAGGCVRKTLNVDTLNATTPDPLTDTARFYATSVERYGDGYIAHGHLLAFYKHPVGNPQGYPADTTLGYTGPFNQRIDRPTDLYFVYVGKQKVGSASSYNYFFSFEGEFSFKPKTDFYLNSSHFVDGPINVGVHVNVQGAKNVDF